MSKNKLIDVFGKQRRQITLVRPLRWRPTKWHHERRHDSNAAMAAKELSFWTLPHLISKSLQSASFSSIGGGRREAKNLRLKDSTLGRENARVCQNLNVRPNRYIPNESC